jgi:hypothetical protein
MEPEAAAVSFTPTDPCQPQLPHRPAPPPQDTPPPHLGQVVVDDVRHVGDVQAARRDVGGDQDAALAAAEGAQRLGVVGLVGGVWWGQFGSTAAAIRDYASTPHSPQPPKRAAPAPRTISRSACVLSPWIDVAGRLWRSR